MLKDCEGTIELVDISDKLPGLQYIPGISHWVLADKFKNIYKTVEEVPEREVNNLRANMFPPTPEEAPKYHLDRAIRLVSLSCIKWLLLKRLPIRILANSTV